MKTRILAVLLAVCMIAGSCVLFASAANTFNKNEYVEFVVDGDSVPFLESNYNGTKPGNAGDLKKASQTVLTVTAKDEGAKLSASVIEGLNGDESDSLSIANLKQICNVTITGSSDSEISAIYGVKNVKVNVNQSTMKATVTGTLYVKEDYADDVIYPVTDDILDTEKTAAISAIQSKLGSKEQKYTLKKVAFSVGDVAIVEQLYDLTMGLRFLGDNGYKNLNASEIGQIRADYKAAIRDSKGDVVDYKDITVYMDKISDLLENTVVTLTASLKDPDNDKEYYQFSYWVDGNGTVLGKNTTYTWKAGTSPSPIYAVFTELKGRVRINYSTTGNGTVAYQEADSENKVTKRAVIIGEGQLSVMEDRTITFVMKPDEGYEVAHVYVNRTGAPGDEYDVAGLLNLVSPKNSFFKALRELINATNKDVYSFTFTKNDLKMSDTEKAGGTYIRSIKVVFQRIENFTDKDGNPVITGWELEPHAQLEPIKAEGLELETGAAAAAAANGGEANPAGAAAGGTTLPAEDGAAGSGASAISGVINPATGSTGAIAVFAALFAAAGVAVVTVKKKED